VVPKSLLSQWEAEINKHLSGLLASGGVHVFYGPRRERDPSRLRRFEFVVTTYDTVRNSLGQARAWHAHAHEHAHFNISHFAVALTFTFHSRRCAQKPSAAKQRGAGGAAGGAAAGGAFRKKKEEQEEADEGADTWGSDGDDDGGDGGGGKSAQACPLASLRLWRVVLDEAHVARNRDTALCRALGRLHAERRVAVSGTPIQNGLSDLYSLLRWLKVPSLQLDAPDTRAGEAAAVRAWASRVAGPLRATKRPQARTLAFARLNALLATVLIRRVKTDAIRGVPLIALPPITYDDAHAPFSEDEAAVYATLWGDAVACFNRHLKAGDVLKNYIFILVKLLRVRQACAHPALVVVPRDACGACRKPLGAGGPSGKLRVARCGHVFCAECIEACIASGGRSRRGRGGAARGSGRGRGAGGAAGGGSARKPARTFTLDASSSDGDDDDVMIVTPAAPRSGSGAGAAAGAGANKVAQQRCKCPLPDCEEVITVRPSLVLPCLHLVPMLIHDVHVHVPDTLRARVAAR
jgi:hypothetical protein